MLPSDLAETLRLRSERGVNFLHCFGQAAWMPFFCGSILVRAVGTLATLGICDKRF
jgi:hypothetical protein